GRSAGHRPTPAAGRGGAAMIAEVAGRRLVAYREFGEGRVEVIVSRLDGTNGWPGPVMVTSPQAQPLGRAWRYREHVDPYEVATVAQAWLEQLPDDYCLAADCADERGHHWSQLTEMLSQVPCRPAERVAAPASEMPRIALEAAVLAWLTTRRRGQWVRGTEIVGCVLHDEQGRELVEVPWGDEGWAVLRELERSRRVVRRTVHVDTEGQGHHDRVEYRATVRGAAEMGVGR